MRQKTEPVKPPVDWTCVEQLLKQLYHQEAREWRRQPRAGTPAQFTRAFQQHVSDLIDQWT